MPQDVKHGNSSLVRMLVEAGLVCPQLDGAGELRFGFQDRILLRAAAELAAQQVPLTRIRRALEQLRRQLPPDRPLTGIRLEAEGRSVVAKDGGSRWVPESGQALLELSLPATSEPVAALGVENAFEAACALEESDPVAAIGAYRSLLERAPRHADALVNLGRLLQERGDFAQAAALYGRALQARPEDATAAFNLGTALEDLGRWDEAIAAYARAIAVDPHCTDAHYNLARLHERQGRKTAAIRHLAVIRRLDGGQLEAR